MHGGASLREAADALAAAIFVRRAFAVSRDAFAIGMRAAGVPDTAPSFGVPRRASSPGLVRSLSDSMRASSHTLAADAEALDAMDSFLPADEQLLADWGLDAWALPDAEVARLCCTMLHSLGLLSACALSPLTLAAFIDDVASRYRDNPFHSFRHAFTVAHTAYLFLTRSALRRTRLRADVDVLALMLAALCHNLEHGGVTNAYLCNSEDPLARRYNDVSPNENHHCAVAFELLDATGLLRRLPAADARMLRKSMVAAILATDMSTHKELLARVTAVMAAGEAADEAVPEATRITLVSFVLHCSDLCNPLLPPSLSRRIAYDLGREFAAQADAERAARLPVTVMEAADEVQKSKMELGFLDFVVRPLFAKLVDMEPTLSECLTRIDANRSMWQSVAATAAAAPAV